MKVNPGERFLNSDELGQSVRRQATWFACSIITSVEALLTLAALAANATGFPDLGGICPKRRSGRESSQHPRRFPPRSTNDTIRAQIARPAPDRVGARCCHPFWSSCRPSRQPNDVPRTPVVLDSKFVIW
jgi:hypothetical protein